MSGKYTIIMIFICACVISAIPSHASHPREIPRVRSNPNNKLEERVNGRENQRDRTGNDVDERDRNMVRSADDTILSVQYDRGFIKELYVSQRAGGSKEISVWRPSVTEKAQICEDLCSAGLGGDPCGYSCLDGTPSSIKNASNGKSATTTSVRLIAEREGAGSRETDSERNSATGSHPRTDVCPALCENSLGKPLCGCQQTVFRQDEASWSSICEAFCTSNTGSYRLKGCPECRSNAEIGNDRANVQNRAKMSTELWVAFCKGQCMIGNGGAACNCDKIPFYSPMSLSAPMPQ